MTIYRVEHNKNYTIINNYIAKDKNLSWKAKGIWMYAFSRPDDWEFHLNDLLNQSTDGRESVRTGIKELEENGYLHRVQKRDKGQFSNADWIFYETPLKKSLPNAENPSTVNLSTENPSTEKSPLLNTDKPKTEKQRTEYTKDNVTDSIVAASPPVGSLNADLSLVSVSDSIPESEKEKIIAAQTKAFNWFMQIGCDVLSAKYFVETYSQEEIYQASGYVKRQIDRKNAKNEKINDIVGYLRRTLENKWWLQSSGKSR